MRIAREVLRVVSRAAGLLSEPSCSFGLCRGSPSGVWSLVDRGTFNNSLEAAHYEVTLLKDAIRARSVCKTPNLTQQ
jgi:hypothetical protein